MIGLSSEPAFGQKEESKIGTYRSGPPPPPEAETERAREKIARAKVNFMVAVAWMDVEGRLWVGRKIGF